MNLLEHITYLWSLKIYLTEGKTFVDLTVLRQHRDANLLLDVVVNENDPAKFFRSIIYLLCLYSTDRKRIFMVCTSSP